MVRAVPVASSAPLGRHSTTPSNRSVPAPTRPSRRPMAGPPTEPFRATHAPLARTSRRIRAPPGGWRHAASSMPCARSWEGDDPARLIGMPWTRESCRNDSGQESAAAVHEIDQQFLSARDLPNARSGHESAAPVRPAPDHRQQALPNQAGRHLAHLDGDGTNAPAGNGGAYSCTLPRWGELHRLLMRRAALPRRMLLSPAPGRTAHPPVALAEVPAWARSGQRGTLCISCSAIPNRLVFHGMRTRQSCVDSCPACAEGVPGDTVDAINGDQPADLRG